MYMRKITYLLTMSLLLLSVTACEKEVFNPGSSQKDFSLRKHISVKVQMPTQGTRCLIFTEYPYNANMAITATPVLEAKSPIDKSISIPKSTEQLYMIANGELATFPTGNIDYNKTAQSRAVENKPAGTEVIDDLLYTYLWNLYPDNVTNVEPEQRNICTDLVVGDEESEVWIAWACGIAGITNHLYFYTYQGNASSINPSTLEMHLLFDNFRDENREPTPEAPKKGDTKLLGSFKNCKIGFAVKCDWGDTQVYKYSTPEFNKPKYGKVESMGVIRSLNLNGKDEYNDKHYQVLGMEDCNSGDGMAWTDYDYNDMICLLWSSPVVIKPENPIDPPETPEGKITQEGMWLFEDNYPEQGDYDFNDVVIKYRIEEVTVNEEGLTSAHAYLNVVATGANFRNKFGINDEWLITDGSLTGYMNVYAGKYTETREQGPFIIPIKKDAEGNSTYIPMLNNGKSVFDLNTYNRYDLNFPNVFEIPTQNFKWCLENKRIDAAYKDYAAWVESGCSDELAGWYKGEVDNTLIFISGN